MLTISNYYKPPISDFNLKCRFPLLFNASPPPITPPLQLGSWEYWYFKFTQLFLHVLSYKQFRVQLAIYSFSSDTCVLLLAVLVSKDLKYFLCDLPPLFACVVMTWTWYRQLHLKVEEEKPTTKICASMYSKVLMTQICGLNCSNRRELSFIKVFANVSTRLTKNWLLVIVLQRCFISTWPLSFAVC